MLSVHYPLNRPEVWQKLRHETNWDDIEPVSIMTKSLPIIIDIQPSKKKTQQFNKDHYNVYVYQILPYPPATKEPHKQSTHT